MGAEQSSNRDGRQNAGSDTARKECYYELLGVTRDVADDEIRKAYKKKALELHPDRNLHDTENATRKFAQVQTAYEILSDPQERAWYDTHRDAVLKGDSEDAGGQSAGHDADGITSAHAIFALMSHFSFAVPMTDEPHGFFGKLNAFFDQLAAEEDAACRLEGISPVQLPAFGNAGDDYESVAKLFYNAWLAFSTRKSFSWMDKYRLADAPDRRVRRLMEKENKKFREDGIREFNDAVMSLVAFVRKRDTRYVPNTQTEAERQQVLRRSAAAQAARSRAANQEKLNNYVTPVWAQSRDDHEHHNDEFFLSEEESEVEHIECVVCKKTFKSENQFQAHEKSKKHAKAVQQLQRQMKKEDRALDLGPSDGANTPLEPGLPSLSQDTEGFALLGEVDGASNGQVTVPCVVDENNTPLPISPATGSDGGTDEYAPRAVVEGRFQSTTDIGQNAPEDQGQGDSELKHPPTNTVGKAKQKRERKAESRAQAARVSETRCAVCGQGFESRTQLFSHIRSEGHAIPVPQKPKGGRKQKG